MNNKEMIEFLKAHLLIAKLDFNEMQYENPEDAIYDEDDDMCKVGYVTGYLEAMKMLVGDFESKELW